MKGIVLNKNWAQSNLGRSIPMYSSSGFTSPASQRPVLLVGGVHGDEPEGVALAEATLEWLQQHLDSEPLVPWALITCINPDGFTENKRTNGRGVDLNRNYPSDNWREKFDQPRYYPGEFPGSEPEVQALVKFIEMHRPRLVIHFHSWKPCIVLSGSAGKLDAEYLRQSSNYEVVEDIGYPTPGSLSQFGKEQNIPIICIEEAEGINKTETWARFSQGLQTILKDLSPENPRNQFHD